MRKEVSVRHGEPAVPRRLRALAVAVVLPCVLPCPFIAQAVAAAPAMTPVPPRSAEPSAIGKSMQLDLGKSTLMRLPVPIERVSVGNPVVADVTVISPNELYLLGKVPGSTNLILWNKGGGATIVDLFVIPDTGLLEQRLSELLPDERIAVRTAGASLILSGTVSSAARAAQAVAIAEAYIAQPGRGLNMPSVAGDKPVAAGTTLTATAATTTTAGAAIKPQVVNLLKIADPQQVMLEVKVAEVQKTLLDKLGISVTGGVSRGSFSASVISNFLDKAASVPGVHNLAGSVTRGSASMAMAVDAAKKDGLIRVLAEPNIVAISGQEASFLAGGKVFIPVATTPNVTTGITTITLEEKEFGVGLKFTPTVLDGGRINLRVAPEVSELSQTGTPFTTIDKLTAILPSMTTRRVQTTVQLMDGQSLAIAGLIKNNVNASINRFPILGEVPILGALFRSNEFQTEQSELMFVITPRLVKPLPAEHSVPTDNHVTPNRADFFLNGKLEGAAPAPRKPAPETPALPAPAAERSGSN